MIASQDRAPKSKLAHTHSETLPSYFKAAGVVQTLNIVCSTNCCGGINRYQKLKVAVLDVTLQQRQEVTRQPQSMPCIPCNTINCLTCLCLVYSCRNVALSAHKATKHCTRFSVSNQSPASPPRTAFYFRTCTNRKVPKMMQDAGTKLKTDIKYLARVHA